MVNDSQNGRDPYEVFGATRAQDAEAAAVWERLTWHARKLLLGEMPAHGRGWTNGKRAAAMDAARTSLILGGLWATEGTRTPRIVTTDLGRRVAAHGRAQK